MAEYINREKAEYINREKALHILRARYDIHQENGDGGCADTLWDMFEAIEKLPAADVVEVRHGEWDNIPNLYMSIASQDGSYSGNATSCSVCTEINPNAYRTPYCPICGAKMDGGKV